MSGVFVDTGAWLALADRRDKYHGAATAVYPQLLQQHPRLITTNLVIAESYALIRYRLGYQPGIRFLRSLRQSQRLARLYTDETVELAAEQLIEKYADQDFSLVDAASFVVMRQHNITEVFAFDHHFLVMGFTLVTAL
ncbi:MAG TPA: PIN domain-containing protein [Chloroflexota bacterium]|nr:PIN domain-containing protein [Chloroflexota bacterium]